MTVHAAAIKPQAIGLDAHAQGDGGKRLVVLAEHPAAAASRCAEREAAAHCAKLLMLAGVEYGDLPHVQCGEGRARCASSKEALSQK